MTELEQEQEIKFKATHGAIVYAFSIAVLMVLQLLFSFVIIGANLKDGSEAYQTVSLVGSALFQAGFFATFVICIKRIKARPAIYLRFKISPWFYVTAALLVVVCLAFFYPIALGFEVILHEIGYKGGSAFNKGNIYQNIIMAVATVFAAPICEELIFRSALLSGLRLSFNRLVTAILSGLAFAFMHMNPQQTVYQFFLGFAAAYIAMSADSVIPAMVLHSVNNLIALTFTLTSNQILLDYSKLFLSSTAALILSSIFFTAAGVGLIIFVCRVLNKRFGNNNNQAQERTKANAVFYSIYFGAFAVCFLIWTVSFFV